MKTAIYRNTLSQALIEKHNLVLSEIESNVADMLAKAGIVVSFQYMGEQKRDNWLCDAWQATITNGKNQQVFDYYTGTGHRKLFKKPYAWERPENQREKKWFFEQNSQPVEPVAAALIHSLILDGDACNYSFEEWCGNFGYDEDSRKALETYLLCQKVGGQLRRIIGNNELLSALSDALQEY
jgi:hypothetical protein